MPSGAALSNTELFWLLSLISLFAVDLWRFAAQRDRLAVYQPPVFVIVFMSYYCLLGPIQRVINNNWIHVINFRFAAVYGWAGATIFYLSLRIGYALFRSWIPQRRFAPSFDHLLAARLGNRLCWLGLVLFTLVTGPRVIAYLNPFNVLGSAFFSYEGIDLGAFNSYGREGVNMLIPGVLLQFAAWSRSGRSLLPWLLWSLATLAIFTSLGFRWRIIALLLPLIILWFITRGRRPNLILLGASGLGLLAIAGFIEQTRSYFAGLQINSATLFSLQALLETGINESAVFLNSGGIISNSPSSHAFVGLQPFISTILIPVPSALWKEKDSFQYLLNATAALYRSDTLGIGQASMNFAEYYLMFGWPSLILMGLLSGWLLRCLWNWFSIRRTETLAQVAYIGTCGFLFIWVSRGYMPQVATTFAFSALPLFWLYYRSAKPRLKNPPAAKIPSVYMQTP